MPDRYVRVEEEVIRDAIRIIEDEEEEIDHQIDEISEKFGENAIDWINYLKRVGEFYSRTRHSLEEVL